MQYLTLGGERLKKGSEFNVAFLQVTTLPHTRVVKASQTLNPKRLSTYRLFSARLGWVAVVNLWGELYG